MFKRLLICIVAGLLAGSPALAQKTKTQLNTEVNTNFPDNTSGLITPLAERTTHNDEIASWQQAPFVRPVTITSDTINLTDFGQFVLYEASGATAVTLPRATGSFSNFNVFVGNTGSGTVTITPTTSTINGQFTLSVTPGMTAMIVSDGTNYQIAGGTALGVNSIPNSIRANPTSSSAPPIDWGIAASNNVEGTGANGLDGQQFFFFHAPNTPSTTLFTTLRADRVASYTGGTAGTVYSSIVGHSSPQTGVANNEWAIVGINDNSSTSGTAQNVGGYFQGNKKVAASSSTWGGVTQCQELAGTANPTTSCTGLEVDVNANGTDTNAQRQGIQVVITKAVGANPAPTVTNGILLSPSGGSPSNGVFVNGILEQGTYTNGLSQTGTYTDGVKLGGTYTIGVDCTAGTFSTACVAVPTGAVISLNNAATTLDGSFSTGAQSPTFAASNKPGTTTATGPGTWIKIVLSGQTFWIPAWAN